MGVFMEKKTCGCTAGSDHDREIPEIDFLSPLSIRGITFRNRIGMSPMCQYSAIDGIANDWHLVHLGSRAVGGAGLVMVEATAVAADGRITPGDMGIWSDEHIAPLARIAQFIKSQGAVPGIQLAHAGRKGSCVAPWKGGAALPDRDPQAWPIVAPSPIPFSEDSPVPIELDLAKMQTILKAFEGAARRAISAGFQVIEIHAAHGYLLHQFLSTLSNRRNDEHGNQLENRAKFLLSIATSLRTIVPKELPLFVRISATDWVEQGWNIEQSVQLCKMLKQCGVDLIDVSSGGNVPKAQIPVQKSYQVPFAKRIRDEADIKTAAVGLITEAQEANEIITSGKADLILLGRELLREPYWMLKAQQEYGNNPDWPVQYGYAVKKRSK